MSLKKFVVVYVMKPTAFNYNQKAIVEAEDAETALLLVKDALGEGHGVRNYVIPADGTKVTEYVAPVSAGRIISLSGG